MSTQGFERFINGFQDRLEPAVQQHLKSVYSCLALTTLAAAAGSYVHLFTAFLQSGILTSIAAIGLLIALMVTQDDGKNHSTRIGYLMGFAFMSGVNLGPLLENAIHIDPTIIATALMGTAVIFIGFTLSSLYTNSPMWLLLGGTLMSGLSWTMMLGLGAMLFQSQMMFQAHLYLGLIVMCCFVAYDTQLIVAKRRLGDKDYIRHSVDLFIDMVGIFRRLLILLTQKEQQQQRKNRK